MALVTVDIPDLKYAAFLRQVADWLDEGQAADQSQALVGSEPTGQGSGDSWTIEVHDPREDAEFGQLVEYVRRLHKSEISRRVHRLLAANTGRTYTGAQIADVLKLESHYAVAGSLGHAGRFASQLGHQSPVAFDREHGEYSMTEQMGAAYLAAVPWSLPDPYTHRVVRDGEEHIHVEDRPYPFAYVMDHPPAHPHPDVEQDGVEIDELGLTLMPYEFDRPEGFASQSYHFYVDMEEGALVLDIDEEERLFLKSMDEYYGGRS